MKYSYIYALIDPRNDKVMYIGKSINPIKRLYNHFTKEVVYKKKDNKSKWLKELKKLKLKPKLKILAKCLYKNENKIEKSFITKYKNLGYSLTNMREGGSGWKMGVKANYSKKRRLEAAKKTMKKVIARNTKNGNEHIFNSVKDCAEFLNITPACVSTLLTKYKHDLKSRKGYYIRYYGEKFIEPVYIDRKIPVISINVKTKKEKYYESISSTRKDGFNHRCVQEIVSGSNKGRHTHKGYKFKYAK